MEKKALENGDVPVAAIILYHDSIIGEGYRFEGTRTERQYIAGLKLLFGSSKKLPSKSRYQPFLDTYFGLGVRY